MTNKAKNTVLYDSAEGLDQYWSRFIVEKTMRGIAITQTCGDTDSKSTKSFFDDGHYPKLPPVDNWNELYNGIVTWAELFRHELQCAANDDYDGKIYPYLVRKI